MNKKMSGLISAVAVILGFMTTSTTLQALPSENKTIFTFISVFPYGAHTHRDSKPDLIIKINELLFFGMIDCFVLDNIDEDLFICSLIEKL